MVLLNVPVPEVEKVTVPVGALGVPVCVSVTVAVQLVGWPAVTGDPQLTVVVVARVAVRANGEPELSLLRWTLLPA